MKSNFGDIRPAYPPGYVRSNFGQVKQFMGIMKQNIAPTPALTDEATAALRVDLIEEELDELKVAIKNDDLIEVADALADILYVTYGAAAAYGIDIDPVFQEVHDSNMSKLGTDGQPIYNEQGKVMKGPGYFHPNIPVVLMKQGLFKDQVDEMVVHSAIKRERNDRVS